MIQLIYAGEELPKSITKSIFLAGPTLRGENNTDVLDWRMLSIQILDAMGYDGVVYLPIKRDSVFEDTEEAYIEQVEWEETCLNVCDKILFWCNFEKEQLPGLTTRDEWGAWKYSGKCIFGAEDNAYKARYTKYYAEKLRIPVYNNLYLALAKCIEELGDGAIRNYAEVTVPLEIWNHSAFKSWYTNLKKSGNELKACRVLSWHRIPSSNKLFAFTIWTKVFIKGENRYKENEFFFGRPDISSCVLYYPNYLNGQLSVLDTEVVLVKEYRVPVNNESGYVFEVPGGSSFKPDEDPNITVQHEIEEETGLRIDKNRLLYLDSKQLQATTLSHQAHVWCYELIQSELDYLKSIKGKVQGNEQDTERTYVEVVTLRDLLDTKKYYLEGSVYPDWSTMGMILQAIHTYEPNSNLL